ncbi:hypothetical protein [Catenibacterium sp.]|uniref:hypothetical protein n=1 Tax=Catenibacterium sp. TaxID=2049022 RepID=UPI002E7A965D|nr:hypothetical protein [Catenibacterium sp.]MEE0042603.1 hypothetical protein [Catenibacterium sp.]
MSLNPGLEDTKYIVLPAIVELTPGNSAFPKYVNGLDIDAYGSLNNSGIGSPKAGS